MPGRGGRGQPLGQLFDHLPEDLTRQAFSHSSWVEDRSASYERLAQRGEVVIYTVAKEEGPPHDRLFETVAEVEGQAVGAGVGRSKKESEQEAARVALEHLESLGSQGEA